MFYQVDQIKEVDDEIIELSDVGEVDIDGVLYKFKSKLKDRRSPVYIFELDTGVENKLIDLQYINPYLVVTVTDFIACKRTTENHPIIAGVALKSITINKPTGKLVSITKNKPLAGNPICVDDVLVKHSSDGCKEWVVVFVNDNSILIERHGKTMNINKNDKVVMTAYGVRWL